MKLSKVLIYALLVTSFIEMVLGQAVTSTSFTTTHPPGSTTTITSEIEIIPTTNDLGQSITLTKTTRLNPPSESTSTTSPQTSTASSATTSKSTTLATSSSSNTLTTNTTSTTTTTSSTSSFSMCSSSAASTSGPRSGNNCFTVQNNRSDLRGVYIACALVLFIVFCICLYVAWWYKRRSFREKAGKDAPWWVHPIYNVRRLFSGADTHTTRRPQRGSLSESARPTISNPVPIYLPSESPPPRPCERPASLSHSLLGEMSTSPILRSISPQELAVVERTTLENEKHRSLSPQPLNIIKNKGFQGLPTRDIEANWLAPPSARSSTSHYSTPFGASSIAGPSQPRAAHIPYRQPDNPPSSKLAQQNFIGLPLQKQHKAAREKLYQQPPFGDEDEENLEFKKLRRDEALRMLEENFERHEPQSGFEEHDDEEEAQSPQSPQSQKSFDFAEHRARHLLAEKRKREDFERNRLANQNDHPPMPELPAGYQNKV